jgi:hypothetical protein
MTGQSTPPAAYDNRTTDHDAIREWIVDHGGRPLPAPDGREAVAFDDATDPADEGDWAAFFDRFEERELVFAYDDAPNVDDPDGACELFDRRRVEASNRLGTDEDGSEGENDGVEDRVDDDGSGDVATDPDHVGDGRSEERHEAATDQENADAHRDEPPFES